MKKSNLVKIATAGLFAAFATLTFTIENLFPPIILPGARMGLSNVFILLSAILLGGIYGYSTLVIKILLGSLFAGNISSIMYSLPAGILSFTIELLFILYAKKTSLVSISVVGAVINTTVQNLAFCLFAGAKEYLVYLPYLSAISVISGLIVGLTVYLILRRLPHKAVKDKFVEE